MTDLVIRTQFQRLCVVSLFILWWALTFSKALVEITFVTALIGWLGWKLKGRILFSNRLPRNLVFPLCGYVLLVVASFFWSEFPKESFRGILKVLKQIMLFLMVMDVLSTQQRIRRFELLFLAVFFVLMTDGAWQYLFGKDFIRGFGGEDSHAGMRITASFNSYGLLASFLITTIPFLFALALTARKRYTKRIVPLIYGAAVLGALLLLFLTRSRGAFLAFLLGLILFSLLRRKLVWLLILFFGLIGSLFILPRSMVFHFDSNFKEQSVIERYFLWDRAVSVIKAVPLTGTGINTYDKAHQKYDQTKSWRVRGYYAHNGYLQLAAEVGIPALLLFLWFLIQYLNLSFQCERSLTLSHQKNILMGLLIGIINFMIYICMDTVLHNPQSALTFWYMLGIQWGYQKVYCSD